MARLFKGAGPGTYWWTNNAQLVGGFSSPPGRPRNAAAVVNHIVVSSHPSPYVSFTASYAVAFEYALSGPAGVATSANPGYVYEIDTSILTGPSTLTLIDPVRKVASAHNVALNGTIPTHHDGGPDLILGIANRTLHGHLLTTPPRRLGATPPRGPVVTDDLNALVFALRDAEVLAAGGVPPACIVNRHAVY